MSRPVSSNQISLHPRLIERVRRHLDTASRKPVATHNRAAFDRLLSALRDRAQPLVLDSFCGTGHSTAALALRHPGHLVVGVDKSARRLARRPPAMPDNCLLLQAECGDLWRLLAEGDIAVDCHYLLYPNPWPKAEHLQRRVHGSPAFHWLLHLAGTARPCAVELRSNWPLYVEEFGVAMHLAGVRGAVARVLPDPPLTPFERKYQASGHPLWAYTGVIRRGATPQVPTGAP